MKRLTVRKKNPSKHPEQSHQSRSLKQWNGAFHRFQTVIKTTSSSCRVDFVVMKNAPLTGTVNFLIHISVSHLYVTSRTEKGEIAFSTRTVETSLEFEHLQSSQQNFTWRPVLSVSLCLAGKARQADQHEGDEHTVWANWIVVEGSMKFYQYSVAVCVVSVFGNRPMMSIRDRNRLAGSVVLLSVDWPSDFATEHAECHYISNRSHSWIRRMRLGTQSNKHLYSQMRLQKNTQQGSAQLWYKEL